MGPPSSVDVGKMALPVVLAPVESSNTGSQAQGG